MHSGGFTFNGRVGGDDDFIHATVLDPLQKRRYAQQLRPNAMQGRDCAVQYMVDAVVEPGLFDGSNVSRLLDHAYQTLVTRRVDAIAAWINVSNIAANGAEMEFLFEIADRFCEGSGIFFAGAQDIKRH